MRSKIIAPERAPEVIAKNTPPAVLADRAARALGDGGLTVPQRLRAHNVIHLAFGAALQDWRRALRDRR